MRTDREKEGEAGELSTYSIRKYEGSRKWCFAIVFNKAQKNLEDNAYLLDETVTRFMRIRKEGWFDEETVEMVCGGDAGEQEGRVRGEVREKFERRLKELRNYFSHYLHAGRCLDFEETDTVRLILEKAYERAKFENRKMEKGEISFPLPDLFEPNGLITSAGAVFFVSFFVERRFLNRLLGSVEGFRETGGEYKATRDVISMYCLRDSYSVKGREPCAVAFRDIMGYLMRVPNASYERLREVSPDGLQKLTERKKDKFIEFALGYLEDYEFKGLREYNACFGRRRIVTERERSEKSEVSEGAEEARYKAHTPKGRVQIHFDSSGDDRFYTTRKNVILRTEKTGGQVNVFLMGVYELKYLVLLSIMGKGREAIEKLDTFIHGLRMKLENVERQKLGGRDDHWRSFPEFIRKRLGASERDYQKRVEARVSHVREKWEKKREESSEMELHKKARDVLRYINERGEKELSVRAYRHMLELLVNRDIGGFERELERLRRRGTAKKEVVKRLMGHAKLNELHKRVCELVLLEMGRMSREELERYVGLVAKEDKEVALGEKLERVRSQPVVYKGFLRERFFKDAKEEKKSFARLVEEAVQVEEGGFDVPLGAEYYKITSLDRFHRDNKQLYETLAADRLCLMMARRHLESMNEKLLERGERVEWKKVNGDYVIILRVQGRGQSEVRIRFGTRDFAKLYVMDDVGFIGRLVEWFFGDEEGEIEYHKVYKDGIKKYTRLQKVGIEAIMELEERIVRTHGIRRDGGYVSFDRLIEKGGYGKDEMKALKVVRDALLHYGLGFGRKEFRTFSQVMKSAGVRKEWPVSV